MALNKFYYAGGLLSNLNFNLRWIKSISNGSSDFISTPSNPRFNFEVLNRLVDKEDSIQIVGLKPLERYTIISQTRIESGNQFGCKVYYKSDSNGIIDLAKHESIGGMYVGVEPMGWFWAMHPSPFNRREHARFLKENYDTPVEVKLNVIEGIAMEQFGAIFNESYNSKCEVKIQKWYAEKGVRKIVIDECGVKGALFIPPGKPPFPGLISLYGAGGPLIAIKHDFRPALLASHGFATLSLEYIGGFESFIDGIELSVLEDAVNYLCAVPEVASDGIGVYGISKGGTVVLAMAAYLENIKCAVAINCSIFSDHTKFFYKGREWLNYGIDCNVMYEDEFIKDCYSMYPCFKLPKVDPEAEMGNEILEFYKSDVPILYSASLDDRNTPTPWYVQYVEQLLQKHNHPCYEIYRYEGAGHLLEPPYSPLCASSYAPLFDNMLVWGGSPLKHCRAQELAWKRHLRFLKTHLTI